MASQFVSNSTVTYDVANDGTTTVAHDITVQNSTSDFYATSYTLSLSGISPVDPIASEANQALTVHVKRDNDTTLLTVDFPDAVVGQGEKRKFSISFTDKSLVQKNGEIWEITTPKLADSSSFDFYSTELKIPDSFGILAYISPNPSFKESKNGKMIFDFDKSGSLKSTITAAFGQFQVFTFELTYHLENPLKTRAQIDIAIPSDTNYQKMNYSKITPIPLRVNVDKDGNWIATFDLEPRQKIDVDVIGAVQLFPSSVNNPKLTPTPEDLVATNLWQVNDPKIQQLAQQLKTPKAIYDYVSSTLSYDYSRVQANVQRLGAVKALVSPKSAICTEFTDLFIAITRAAHIPAREIEGFAYTDNPQIRPLSLVADVLHAWPEYWDETKQTWIPVDPTWGSTSGIDYFTKLDLKHFAFVVHGAQDTKPYPAGSYKLGQNPQKDVNVTFGSLPQNRNSNLQVENKVINQLPFSDEIVDTKILNKGPVAVYNTNFQLVFDNTKIVRTEPIAIVPPYGYFETKINIPYSFLGQKTPQKAEILIDGKAKSEIGTYKTFLVISNLLMLSLFIFFVVFLVYLKFHDAKTKKSTG
jgi:transglutaminase-like putative cysteine protease